jgi:hypothetical protein
MGAWGKGAGGGGWGGRRRWHTARHIAQPPSACSSLATQRQAGARPPHLAQPVAGQRATAVLLRSLPERRQQRAQQLLEVARLHGWRRSARAPWPRAARCTAAPALQIRRQARSA